MKIFMDESGYTGEDLANQDQPVFVLASTNLSDGECTEIRRDIFGFVNSRELKHSQLARTSRGQGAVVDFVKTMQSSKDQLATCFAHKEYALLAYLVDLWVEPPMHDEGLDLSTGAGTSGS